MRQVDIDSDNRISKHNRATCYDDASPRHQLAYVLRREGEAYCNMRANEQLRKPVKDWLVKVEGRTDSRYWSVPNCSLTGKPLCHAMYSLSSQRLYEYGAIVPAIPELAAMPRADLVAAIQVNRPIGQLQLVYHDVLARVCLADRMLDYPSWRALQEAQFANCHQRNKESAHVGWVGLTLGQDHLLRRFTGQVWAAMVSLAAIAIGLHVWSGWQHGCQIERSQAYPFGPYNITFAGRSLPLVCQDDHAPNSLLIQAWYWSGVVGQRIPAMLGIGLSFIGAKYAWLTQQGLTAISQEEQMVLQKRWKKNLRFLCRLLQQDLTTTSA